MTGIRRVIVAGGGIGGMAAALALQHKGFDSVVFERAQALRDGGAGVHLWTNGMLALDSLGVADHLLKSTVAQQFCHFSTWRGEVMAAWRVGEFAERHGQPTIGVERSALHAALRNALGGSQIHAGARVIGCTQDERGVAVRLADGQVERGDLLIGADGIHSAVRAGLHGTRPPRYNGYIAQRGKAFLRHDLIPPGSFNAMFGPGIRFVYYDVAPGVVHWMSVANGPAAGHDDPGVLRTLTERHRDWAAPVGDILAATPPSGIIRSEALDRKPDRRWGAGRVTLLGDAAHPMAFNIGQGACQAVEDAVVLAECLASAPADPVSALRAYEKERRARTARLQRAAWWLGRMAAVEHPALVRMREAFMRSTYPKILFAAERNQMRCAARALSNSDQKFSLPTHDSRERL
ncbi:FAD-dependent oxidoreductase [Nocardia sp. bgisy134]|uniref:FAD-dependent oxidoreductase n=1 Tax=Nocardia sp. bgisy134 TaxID=3413789 RepID=UPI003D746C7B